MEKLTKKDIRKVFWRSNLLMGSWNYERMQSLGFLYSIKPVLKKLYGDKPKEERSKAMKRHLEFFNTMPTFASPILGVTAALEEKEGNKADRTISGIKVGLMGPLAGLGDSIVFFTWLPICMSIGASFAKEGNPFGLVIALLMFNALNMGIKFYGINYGYREGIKFLDKAKDSGVVQRFTTMATILGLILVGGLIPQLVNINIPTVFNIGELELGIQATLDSILPKLIPLLTTLGCYKLLKKGKSSILILFGIIALSIVGVLCGFLG